MVIKLKGNEGDYLVKNSSTIVQYKKDSNGKRNGKSILHIIVDSIENNEDRLLVQKNIKMFY
jgi:hypothetical protein